MKKLFFVCLTGLLCLSSFAQFRQTLDVSLAESFNLNLSTAYKIHFHKDSPVYFAPQIGLGQAFLWGSDMSLQGGLIGGFEINSKFAMELSSSLGYLFESPFFPRDPDTYIFHDGAGWQSYNWINTLDFRYKPGKITYLVGAGITYGLVRNSYTKTTNINGLSTATLKMGISL